MDIRTLTGKSISEALSEARSLWGDSVVMLQAEPTSQDGAARISVGIPARQQPSNSSVNVAVADRPLRKAPSAPALAPGQMRRRRRSAGTLSAHVQPMAEVLDHIQTSASGMTLVSQPTDNSETIDPRSEGLPSQGSALRAAANSDPGDTTTLRLYTTTGDSVENTDESTEASPEIEEPISRPIPVVDPHFAQLVKQGIRPSRARRLCDIASGAGTDKLIAAIARDLPPAATGRAPSRVAFIGEAGCGKTSLVLRAAMSRLKAGRRAPVVVIIAPPKDELLGWQDPTQMLESVGLEVLRCSGEALESALAGLQGDVIVDTPASFKIPPHLELHTRLVIDARSSGAAVPGEASPADSVILTHVDRAPTLGYAAERMIAQGTPVAAIVRCGQPHSGLEAYTPRRFAQQICA